MPAYFITSMFMLTLVSATRPLVDQSGGGRFGKVVAPPEPKKEVPVPTADEEVHETSLEEEVDEVPVETKGKPARSWDTRVREISGKLLNRFTSDFGSTTSTVAKALGRASAAVQGIPLPGATFFSTVLAVVIGSSPIARTSGMYFLGRLFGVVEDILAYFGGYGLNDRYNPLIGDPQTGYPVYRQRRIEAGIENVTDYKKPLNFSEAEEFNATSYNDTSFNDTSFSDASPDHS
ncbi:uncharacterized protein [Macrobrachium rosenbergii]|uniref:uncharacterized protein isoform X1 n=1 Tax=Macrobrachium rosenbergii TaxID=79674 RepID=UPI0034D39FF0